MIYLPFRKRRIEKYVAAKLTNYNNFTTNTHLITFSLSFLRKLVLI